MLAFHAGVLGGGFVGVEGFLITSMVIAAGCKASHQGIGQRVLSSRPLQLAGKYSFSLYLWHWPILVLKLEHFKWLYAS